eukprot:jgi/Mesvir1/26965/Mv20682-RA.2
MPRASSGKRGCKRGKEAASSPAPPVRRAARTVRRKSDKPEEPEEPETVKIADQPSVVQQECEATRCPEQQVPASSPSPPMEDQYSDDDRDVLSDEGDIYLSDDGGMCFVDSEDDKKPDLNNSLDEDDRRRQQEQYVDEVSQMTGLSSSYSGHLLRFFKWNKEELITKYLDNPGRVCKSAGISGVGLSEDVTRNVHPAFECSICRNSGDLATTLVACGHEYCDECWRHYLELKISEGETRINCPAFKCEMAVTETVIEALCSKASTQKFKEFCLKSFVDENSNVVWCPSPGCNLAIDASKSTSQFVTCQLGHEFCMKCRHENHAPTSCELVKAWLKKCDDDSETVNWISANTQDCPKCETVIEKNGASTSSAGCAWRSGSPTTTTTLAIATTQARSPARRARRRRAERRWIATSSTTTASSTTSSRASWTGAHARRRRPR